MKITTKYKIVAFVEKILGLPDTSNHPLYNIKTSNIQKIRSEHVLNEIESDLFKVKEEYYMDHLKQEMAVNVAKVMQQIGAIRYEIDTDFNSGNVKITAITYVPEKL